MLSVVIIVKNEERLIKTCLESVKWADQIIVLDNGSSDKTCEIAREYTKEVFTYNNLDFSSLRNKGVEKAKEEWVLFIDSDERVLAPLKEEILRLIHLGKFSAVAISRKNIIFGQEVNYGPYKKDWVIRLLKKSDFDSWVGRIHEYPKFKGELGYSDSSFLHLTHRDIDHLILKSLEWSKIDAKLRLESKHPPMSGWRFIRIFITETINQGIKRRGFFGGTVGIIDSILQVFSLYISYVRLWQLQHPKQLDAVYEEIDKKLMENNFEYS